MESKSDACAPTILTSRTKETARNFRISAFSVSAFSFEGFFIYHVRHLCRISAVISFQDIDYRLRGASGHSLIWIHIEPGDHCAACKMMEDAAAIRDFRVEQRRVRGQR